MYCIIFIVKRQTRKLCNDTIKKLTSKFIRKKKNLINLLPVITRNNDRNEIAIIIRFLLFSIEKLYEVLLI